MKKPIDVAPEDLATVLEILREHVPDREVLAFGSRVSGTAKKFSDLDLAIVGDDPVPSRALAALNEAFDESELPFKVDVVEWASTSASFRAVIRRTAVPLQPPAAGTSRRTA